VRGNQDVRYAIVYLFCKWPIRLDRDSDMIKIGCIEKSISEWTAFFANKAKINTDPSDRNYKKIEMAFKASLGVREALISMNDKPKI